MLQQAPELKRRSRARAPAPHLPKLVMNDRADLCLAAEFDGVHVGQDDLSPESVRRIIGPDRWLGVSTHNSSQLQAADRTSADYLAIGPVFLYVEQREAGSGGRPGRSPPGAVINY